MHGFAGHALYGMAHNLRKRDVNEKFAHGPNQAELHNLFYVLLISVLPPETKCRDFDGAVCSGELTSEESSNGDLSEIQTVPM